VLDSANPRAFAGVLRRLRTELGKLPGREDRWRELLALLPAQGPGLTLDVAARRRRRGHRRRAAGLAAPAGGRPPRWPTRSATRYFTLAHGMDQRV
jgi:hypothetical protein